MKNQIIFILAFLLAMPLLYAFPAQSGSNRIYVDFNQSYPLVLIPLDNNVWNITLYTANNSFNFTWTGTQYQLSILFSQEGDYPFVINSTQVSGEITGIFLVRKSYIVRVKLYNQKSSIIPFLSNVYKNNFGYVTAEFTDKSFLNHPSYNPTLEKYLAPLNFRLNPSTRMFSAPYINGEADLKLWERNQVYGLRFMDGIINFNSLYSVPQINKSYGITAYLGTFSFNGSSMDLPLFVSHSDLYPWFTPLNWIMVILILVAVLVSIFLFFMIPDKPSVVITLGLGFSLMIVILRIFVWFIFQ